MLQKSPRFSTCAWNTSLSAAWCCRATSRTLRLVVLCGSFQSGWSYGVSCCTVSVQRWRTTGIVLDTSLPCPRRSSCPPCSCRSRPTCLCFGTHDVRGDELWEVIRGASGMHPATHSAADWFLPWVHDGKDDLDVDAGGLAAPVAQIADETFYVPAMDEEIHLLWRPRRRKELTPPRFASSRRRLWQPGGREEGKAGARDVACASEGCL